MEFINKHNQNLINIYILFYTKYKFLKKLHSLVMKIRPLTNSKKYKHNNI